MKLIDVQKGAAKIVNEEIKQELKDQGHYLTGALDRSIDEEIDGDDITGQALEYLNRLNDGVAAANIGPLNKSSSEFRKLVQWVKQRGLEHNGERFMTAESIAEAIWRKWQKEGMPTENSKMYSKTGERTGALNIAFASVEDKLDRHMNKGLDAVFETEYRKQKSETI